MMKVRGAGRLVWVLDLWATVLTKGRDSEEGEGSNNTGPRITVRYTTKVVTWRYRLGDE
jgi:hypothetical protein